MVVMEAFSQMMIATMDRDHPTSFSVGSRNNEELIVFHLLFADDTLIFCDANSKQIQHLQCIFLCFEAVSRLRLNLTKSEIVPIGQHSWV